MPESFERAELRRWFKKIWRNTEGAVKLAFQIEKDLFWQNVMFAWPSQEEAIVEWVLAKVGQGADVFYAPALFKDRTSGKSKNVLGSWTLWAEFDGNAPDHWVGVPFDKYPEPSVRLQSSIPGRQHCYWLLDEFISKETVESKNRALAYELGADTSGWDAGQVLRPVSTRNFGHAKAERRGQQSLPVEILVEKDHIYGPSIIEVPAHFVEIVKNAIDLTQLPSLALVLAKGKWTDKFYTTFFADRAPEKGVRSDALMEIGYLGAEAGLSDSEIYVLVEAADSRWCKYTNRTPDRRFNILADIVERARFKHPYGSAYDFVADFGKPRSATQVVYTNPEFRELKVEYKWCFENLLSQNGLGMIAGEPGVGKTQLSNQLGICTASGQNFLSWKNSLGPQKTLLLQLEMPLAGMQKFLGMAQSSLDSDILQSLDQNLLISPLSSALPLDSEPGRKFLIDLVKKYMPKIIVIDSLAKSTTKSLNEDVPSRQLNDWIQEFRKNYGVTVVIIHHSRKGLAVGSKKHDQGNAQDDLFGSRYLTGDLDFILACYKIPKRKGYVYVRNAKNRYAEEHPDLTILRQPDLTFKVDKVHDDEDGVESFGLLESFLNAKSDRGSSS